MTTLKELTIKGGIREGFREGTSKMADRSCFGYTKSSDDDLIINETEAKIVKWIFDRYLSGNSLGKIADALAEQNILSPTGNQKWNRQAIDKLISNEKYIGCILLQKTVTEDGLQIRNRGQASQYLYKNNHPAIISQETFKAAQCEKLSRSKSPEKETTPEWILSL